MEVTHQPTSSPVVYAVILTTNECGDAIQCIRSMRESTYPFLKIIVVDNASTDDGAGKIMSLFPDVQVIVRSENRGYSAGNNTGIRAALEQGAEYVLISNSDIIVERNFLQPLVSAAEKDPRVGLVIGTLRYTSEPDRLYYAAGKFSRLLCTGLNTTRSSRKILDEKKDVDVDFVNGALFLIRRKVFEVVGLFEEKFFLYYDDLEFSRRCARHFRMVYAPNSVSYHKSGGGVRWKTYTENYLYYSTKNRIRAFEFEPLWYRAYVVCYNAANVMAKSAVIASNVMRDQKRTAKQIRALWRGLRDGLFSHGSI